MAEENPNQLSEFKPTTCDLTPSKPADAHFPKKSKLSSAKAKKHDQKNMITPRPIRDLLHEVPFKPFLLTMSDGRQYPVPNHDVAVVGRNDVMVGVDLHEQFFAERWVRCAILHITSMEGLDTSGPRRRKTRKS